MTGKDRPEFGDEFNEDEFFGFAQVLPLTRVSQPAAD